MHLSYEDQLIKTAAPFIYKIAASWYADAPVLVHAVLKK